MVFERLQRRIARLKAEDPAVTMDHDIHEVGILESDRGPSERRFIELPTGRPDESDRALTRCLLQHDVRGVFRSLVRGHRESQRRKVEIPE